MTEKEYLEKAFEMAFELCGAKDCSILAFASNTLFNQQIDKNQKEFSFSYKSYMNLYKQLKNDSYSKKGAKSKTEDHLAAYILLKNKQIDQIEFKINADGKPLLFTIYWQKFKDWIDNVLPISKLPINTISLKNLAGFYYGIYRSSTTHQKTLVFLRIHQDGSAELRHRDRFYIGSVHVRAYYFLYIALDTGEIGDKHIFACNVYKELSSLEHIKLLVFHHSFTRGTELITGKSLFLYEENATTLRRLGLDDFNTIPLSVFKSQEIFDKFDANIFDRIADDRMITPKTVFLDVNDKLLNDYRLPLASASLVYRPPLKNLIGIYHGVYYSAIQDDYSPLILEIQKTQSTLKGRYNYQGESRIYKHRLLLEFYSEAEADVNVTLIADLGNYLYADKHIEYMLMDYSYVGQFGIENGRCIFIYSHEAIDFQEVKEVDIKKIVHVQEMLSSIPHITPSFFMGNNTPRSCFLYEKDFLKEINQILLPLTKPSDAQFPDLNDWEFIFDSSTEKKMTMKKYAISQTKNRIIICPSLFRKDGGKGENYALIKGSYEEDFFVIDIDNSSVRISIYAEKTNFDRKTPMLALISGKKVESLSMTAFHAVLYHKDTFKENEKYILNYLRQYHHELIVKETFYQYKLKNEEEEAGKGLVTPVFDLK